MGHPPDHPWWIIESPHYNNDHDGVSIHQPHGCLLNCLFRCRSKKTPKLCTTGLCARNSPVTGEFPAQRASNAENVSILWRHHANHFLVARFIWLIFKTQNFHVFRLTMSHLSRVGSPIRWLGGGGVMLDCPTTLWVVFGNWANAYPQHCIWTNVGTFSIGPLQTNLLKFDSRCNVFLQKNELENIVCNKCCLGLNILTTFW